MINILIRMNLNVKWCMVAEEALHHKAYRQTIGALSARLQQLKLEMCPPLETSRQTLGFMLGWSEYQCKMSNV